MISSSEFRLDGHILPNFLMFFLALFYIKVNKNEIISESIQGILYGNYQREKQIKSWLFSWHHFTLQHTGNGFTAHPYSLLYETYCIQHDSMEQTVDWHSCLVL